MLDNHIQQGNALGIDVKKITWRRCVDMNDRQLRNIVDGLGGRMQGVPREDGFDITVASEIMAVLCLATGLSDLKERLGRMIVGYTYDDKPVTAADLKAQGAMAALLKDAIKPNLVQTLEHTPALVHGGPFANIAHGCNSVSATATALKLADYVVTEAGFGADLGAEKFLDIKCRAAGLTPDAVVIVATVKARAGGGKPGGSGAWPAQFAQARGEHHPCVRPARRGGHQPLRQRHRGRAEPHPHPLPGAGGQCGGEGGLELAEEVLRLCDQPQDFHYAYDLDLPLKDKIQAIVEKVYGGAGVHYTAAAAKELARLEAMGFDKLPVCMAKTQYSLSDDASQLGRPEGFTITVSKVKVSAGAGFVVVQTGDIMTMPGLPKVPAAEKIDVDENGVISGLF